MNELTNYEKTKLGHEAFSSFLAQFEPFDVNSIILAEVIFELLLDFTNEKARNSKRTTLHFD
jgi:hypothetical protein